MENLHVLRRVLSTLVITLAAGFGLAAIPAKAQPQSAVKVQAGDGRPYEIADSEVWDVPDPVSRRGYQVFVALPPSYAKEPQRTYPVLYVTDADYAFPILRQISRRLNGEGPKVEEFILVGLSYANGEDGAASRRRDYTPTPKGADDDTHGKAGAYQAYLRNQVKPFIAQRYRTDPARSVFLGHSYGGLLGAQILLTEPTMFSGYILGSPSFWFAREHYRELESGYAARSKDLPAKVFLYVGEYETVRKGDPRFNRTGDMVGDNRAFEKALKERKYPNLGLKSVVLNDEDHLTVAPRGFTQGLRYLLPSR
ncbi:MAG TPA: alpha/beta hydrolase-fold protein [Bosea sp. (in: a-proteobacteria)]|nr:alpha/beta hydrolase-fold protein [Bosea sp. (in: a-proteobacteria)]